MRSRLNVALVAGAGALALVLTVIRQSPEGVVSLGIDTREVRAAPTDAAAPHHDLSALTIFNRTLMRVKERYVDPSRIDPKKMLFAALDSVQLNIPEVLVEPDPIKNKVAIAVNDKRETFDTDDVDSLWRMTSKLKQIFRFVELNMNAGEDLSKVEYAAVNGVLSTLDPHSILMDPEQARDMDVSTSGKFGGLGIVVRMIDRKLTVVKPMKDTPAWRAGVKAQDHIVKINSEPTENLTSNEAVERMRGDPNTGVTLWIERKGVTGLQKVDLKRAIIHVAQVEHKLLDHGVGYIRVKGFSKGIASDAQDAMREMQAQGATSWVLDLRYNPGGLLEEAIELSDLFVDNGTVVTTVSSHDREARRADHRFGDINGSLAVLVNQGSASASEIVAGALKNLDRAVIIGTRTFGKGSVQELYDNDDKSKLKLTIAQYLTPGDRSIQNLGIVPDIALQRMYVPTKNDSPQDFVRLLPPTRSYGEKDLDAHLVSTYAKDTDKPEYELPFLIERKAPDPVAPTPGAGSGSGSGSATPTPAPPPPPIVDDEDGPDEDDIKEDFEIKLAKDLVSSVHANNRVKLAAGAANLVARVRAEQEKQLAAELTQIGVDWSGPAAGEATTGANLDVSVTTKPSAGLKAGDIVDVTATVKNTGTAPAYRVLSRVTGDDPVFEDSELPVGKVGPGETKTFTAKIEVPKESPDRFDRLGLEVRDAKSSPTHVTPAEIKIEAAPRPVFAFEYQLIDDGNGDGLVQRGEKYHFAVTVKNTGVGIAPSATALLRNASGDGVLLDKSRFEIGALPPGATKQLDFPLATDGTLHGDELVLELMAYDDKLDVQSSEKVHFKLAPEVAAVPVSGNVSVKAATVAVHSGASEDASTLGTLHRGSSFPAIATFGPWTKLKLNAGGTMVGFVPSSSLSSGGSGSGTFEQAWNSTPPMIALNTKALETSADTYKLTGQVTDDTHVEDVYVFVSNQSAKIESRKVFYRSNRGGKNSKVLDFTADLPMWPGSNVINVVARESSEVRSLKTVVVFREQPRTAQVTPPATGGK